MYLKMLGPEGQSVVVEIGGAIHVEKRGPTVVDEAGQAERVRSAGGSNTRLLFDPDTNVGSATGRDHYFVIVTCQASADDRIPPLVVVTNWTTYLLNEQGRTVDTVFRNHHMEARQIRPPTIGVAEAAVG